MEWPLMVEMEWSLMVDLEIAVDVARPVLVNVRAHAAVQRPHAVRLQGQ